MWATSARTMDCVSGVSLEWPRLTDMNDGAVMTKWERPADAAAEASRLIPGASMYFPRSRVDALVSRVCPHSRACCASLFLSPLPIGDRALPQGAYSSASMQPQAASVPTKGARVCAVCARVRAHNATRAHHTHTQRPPHVYIIYYL